MLPIVAYGSPALRKKSLDITQDYPNLKELIDNMFDSMYASKGIGLAAPQIGKAIRLFIIDARPYSSEIPDAKDFVKVFINAKILNESGEEWFFNEGCLSVPGINEDVWRKDTVEIEYLDENFEYHKETYSGVLARIIQHEYDHLEGVLFVDKLSPLKKTLIKGKLQKISKGEIDLEYKMVFNKK